MVTTRKSTGRLPPPRLDQNLDQGQDSEDEEEVEIEAQRPKKRRKTSKGTRKSGVEADASFIPTSVVNPGSRRRQAGKLALIMSMPVDVFCEIAAHLSPEDLLRMARSTKVLRNFLMSKDSKLIWHKAEEASGMPICPSDLSSPQYASLIFDKHCTHCNSVRSSRLEVGLRVRLCKKCHNKNVRYGLKLMSPKPTSLSDSEWISILKLVPGSGFMLDWHAKGFQTLTLDVMLELKYYRPTFESTFEKYQALGCTPDKQKVFVEEKHKMTREAWLHTAELDDWLDDIEEQKHEDRQALKSRRKDSILGKLEELGYSRADFNTELDERGWRWNALVEQPRELTDKAWNNLHPRLEQIIHLRREKKAQREKEDRVRAREKRLLELVKDFIQSDTSFILSVLAPELLEFPLAREIVDNDDLPIEFSLDILYPLKGELIATSNARILEIETNLIPKICSVSSVESKDIDKNPILRHATTFFYIDLDSYETTPTTLHKILADLQAQCRNSFNYAFKYSFASLWQPASITPSPRLVGIAEALIAATELPPDSTMDDANSLGMSFVCMCCLPEVRMLMTWFDLIKHFNDEYCIFEITERAKELRKSDVTLIFDHDVVEQTKPLAVHTGLRRDSNDKSDPPGVDKWVKKCSCADCAAGLLFSTHQCEQCALYGSDQFFFCLGKLDAHLRARHAYIREVKCE